MQLLLYILLTFTPLVRHQAVGNHCDSDDYECDDGQCVYDPFNTLACSGFASCFDGSDEEWCLNIAVIVGASIGGLSLLITCVLGIICITCYASHASKSRRQRIAPVSTTTRNQSQTLTLQRTQNEAQNIVPPPGPSQAPPQIPPIVQPFGAYPPQPPGADPHVPPPQLDYQPPQTWYPGHVQAPPPACYAQPSPAGYSAPPPGNYSGHPPVGYQSSPSQGGYPQKY